MNTDTPTKPVLPFPLASLSILTDDLEQTAKNFAEFKLAATLVGDAARDAESWKEVTIHLENAFQHPLYQEDRNRYADSLAAVIATGVLLALE